MIQNEISDSINEINNSNKNENLEDNKNTIENKVQNIIERDPKEELKLIQEKIKLENEKINEINSKLDKIGNNKKTIKRNFEINDDYYTNVSINNTKKQNILFNKAPHKLIPIKTEKNINYSLDGYSSSPEYNIIHQKMKELKNTEIINKKSDLNSINSLKLSLPSKRMETEDNINIKINKLIEKEREEKKKIYDNKIKLFHDKELENEKKRKKIIEHIRNIPSNANNKNYTKKYYYLSAIEKEELRKQKEEMLLKMEKEKRKQKYLPISSEELNEFSKEVTKNKKLLETELGLKKKQMEEIWKERKNLLPKHHSKFMDLNIEYDKEAKEELILKQERLKSKELERINFSKDVAKNYLPKKLNDKLKTEREQRIKELNGKNRLNNIKELGNKLKEKSKKVVLSQPKNFGKKNIFVIEPNIKEIQSKKLTGKPVDYLLEQRIKNNKLDYQQLMQSNSSKKMKKWNKMLDEQGINIVNNVKKIQIEANIMNNKASNINQILKLESNNNPKNDELKKEATNYYINSIQAKLQVLNKISSS